ncbi:E3 ubiquitin-protein ligase BRE1-like 2 isoform X2 [Diospyros lotus]|uniref:E3 ubiquitin-protein ligase BRE1-like 2 isoform X2 n=1 Tax=Diospyros lotus TaxID=55363 RepID=UPI0022583E21|nr:E3 ubiquitin-protein ligase BRE1-like 2 isoform X2 [Diospyros lotus]
MEGGGWDDQSEKKKKRPHSSAFSSPSPLSHTVDAAALQNQNQKLVQQLDVQKHELHDLEGKIKELQDKQASYDNILIIVNKLWKKLVDDLILLGVRAGPDQYFLQALDRLDHSRGSVPSCPAEEVFLCRLLERDSIGSSQKFGSSKDIEEALAVRIASTQELMKSLQNSINTQRSRILNIAQALHKNPSANDIKSQLSAFDNLMKEEAAFLHEAIDVLHLKHKDYANMLRTCIQGHSVDQSEINRLAGELDESMAELEECRRKLVNLKMQKGTASGVHTSVPGSANGSLSPEKPADRTLRLLELKDSIEETKILAADRLSELQDAQEDNLILSKQLQDLQDEIKDGKYVYSSRAYTLLNDQLQHWNAQLDRYKGLMDSLQADRSSILRREKELNAKAESLDAVRNDIANSESKIEELKLQLQNSIVEKNTLEIKMEEVLQDSGRKDVKAEFHVMSSALSKELEMMEAQLNRWKETAHEANSLRGEAQSLKVLLGEKTGECKSLATKCSEQDAEIKSLKLLVEKMQKGKVELQILLDMLGQQIYDNRDITQIKESEQRARAQAQHLRHALDEHGLELRIKAANEAEAACQKRLSAAEAEIAALRAELDASDRDVLELEEAVKSKDAEAEVYVSEIETIGQAYEDMQAQNQRLLQQVAERDDYNIKLVSESVKMKQAQSFLLSEKQVLSKQSQQVNGTLESLQLKIADREKQIKVCIAEALKSTQEDRRLAVNLETAKWELADAEKELKWVKSSVSSSEKEYEQLQRKKVEVQTELDKERGERYKVEEELKEVHKKIAEMSCESGEAAIQKLQDEIKECKAILKCGVCFDRPKEVVITKCYHLFCSPCIQRNLELRHRKCPGCGTAFGQNDVRFVKI